MGQILYIGSPFQNSIRKHLTAYYPFNSDFEDKVAPKVNLSSSGTSTISLASGRIGNAAFCPAGTNTVLRNTTDPSRHKLSFTNGTNDLPFSISAHIFITSVGSVSSTIFGKNAENSSQASTNAEYTFGVSTDLNRIVFRKYSEGSNSNYTQYNANVPYLDEWIHLVITDDANGDFKIYINGVEAIVSAINSGSGFVKFSQTLNSNIGCFSALGVPANTRFFNGGIDDLGVWVGRVLTQQDIDWIYNGGSPRPLM